MCRVIGGVLSDILSDSYPLTTVPICHLIAEVLSDILNDKPAPKQMRYKQDKTSLGSLISKEVHLVSNEVRAGALDYF